MYMLLLNICMYCTTQGIQGQPDEERPPAWKLLFKGVAAADRTEDKMKAVGYVCICGNVCGCVCISRCLSGWLSTYLSVCLFKGVAAADRTEDKMKAVGYVCICVCATISLSSVYVFMHLSLYLLYMCSCIYLSISADTDRTDDKMMY